MTPAQQAELEQVAREFLTDDKNEFDLSPTGEPYRFQVEALTTLFAAQRVALLEEVYQFVANYHVTKMTTTAKPALRVVTDIEDWLRQQAKERS